MFGVRALRRWPSYSAAVVIATLALGSLAGCTSSSGSSGSPSGGLSPAASSSAPSSFGPSESADSPSGASSSQLPSSQPSTSSGSTAATGLSQQADLSQQYVTVVKHVLPSVVQITTDSGLGSGVVFDDHGDIVTNDHVVGESTTFHVTSSTGSGTLKGTLVGAYPPDDLAVIHVSDHSGLHAAQFGDSTKLEVGQIVLAMGNPLGLSASVTNGIVSAVGRTVSEPQGGDSPGATLPDVIQTSAAINPGNSGGALVDLSGDVVGIPTLAATDQQLGGGAAPGIGFAIPSDIVKRIAPQLIRTGKVTNSGRAALGVRVRTVLGGNLKPAGVGIVDVQQGGAAATAGLQAGEVITAINGKDTPTTAALSHVLADLKPGDHATVTVEKSSGESSSVTVTLGQLSGS